MQRARGEGLKGRVIALLGRGRKRGREGQYQPGGVAGLYLRLVPRQLSSRQRSLPPALHAPVAAKLADALPTGLVARRKSFFLSFSFISTKPRPRKQQTELSTMHELSFLLSLMLGIVSKVIVQISAVIIVEDCSGFNLSSGFDQQTHRSTDRQTIHSFVALISF